MILHYFISVIKLQNNYSVKPNFILTTRATLIENEKFLSDERELVKIFNEYFSNIASNLDIQLPPNISLHYDRVLSAIQIIEKHPSILEIKNKFCLM